MNNRTTMQTLLLVVGVLVLLGGLVCVVAGFVGFAGSDPTSDGDSSLALFAGGGFAAVIGLAIVGFTRVGIMARNGSYARVTIEQGTPTRAGGFCSACGAPRSTAARFCESCGAAVG